jgi:uncharacterized RDD family membrane protein YckC
MSSTPEEKEPGQPRGQQTAHPGEAVPPQGAAPEGQPAGASQAIPGQQPPGYPGMTYPRQEPWRPAPYGQQPPDWAAMPGAITPVSQRATRATPRRVVQYAIDYILAGIIPGLAYWLFDRGPGLAHGLGWLVATVIALAVYFWYWVVRPYGHRGQTFGMQLFGLRVISKDGRRASMMQLFIRGVLLIVDTLFFGLVGLITILCSRYRQRVGDHAAKTVVVRERRLAD